MCGIYPTELIDRLLGLEGYKRNFVFGFSRTSRKKSQGRLPDASDLLQTAIRFEETIQILNATEIPYAFKGPFSEVEAEWRSSSRPKRKEN